MAQLCFIGLGLGMMILAVHGVVDFAGRAFLLGGHDVHDSILHFFRPRNTGLKFAFNLLLC